MDFRMDPKVESIREFLLRRRFRAQLGLADPNLSQGNVGALARRLQRVHLP